MSLEFTTEQIGEVAVVVLRGHLDASSAPNLDAALREHAASTPLVLDLSALDYTSSAGLRVVLAAAKRSAAAHGKFAIGGAHGTVQQVLDISGFSSMLAVHPSRDEALAAVR